MNSFFNSGAVASQAFPGWNVSHRNVSHRASHAVPAPELKKKLFDKYMKEKDSRWSPAKIGKIGAIMRSENGQMVDRKARYSSERGRRGDN